MNLGWQCHWLSLMLRIGQKQQPLMYFLFSWKELLVIVDLNWGHFSALFSYSSQLGTNFEIHSFKTTNVFLTKKNKTKKISLEVNNLNLIRLFFHTDIDKWAISHLKAIILGLDLYLTREKKRFYWVSESGNSRVARPATDTHSTTAITV